MRRLFYKIFKRYRRLELRFLNYEDADRLIKQNAIFSDTTQHWVIAKEEDTNNLYGFVWIERKERIS